MCRDKKKFCPEAFSAKLNDKLSSLISSNFPLSSDKFDRVFYDFVEAISLTIESHAPLKRMSRKQLKLAKKAWITEEILTSIRKKNAMFQSHYIFSSDAEKSCFRRYSNRSTKIKALSKKLFFGAEFATSKGNDRKTWEIIRSALPTNSSRESPSALKVGGVFSEDPNIIANQFNNYFGTIGFNLANKITSLKHKSSKDFLKRRVSESIFLAPPDATEVFDPIMSLKDKAVGHDRIPSFFLKVAKDGITPHLTLFIEYTFTDEIFPRSCKIARIVPIFKSVAKDEASNYRPVSILTCFSEIIEKLIYVRFFNFFKKHDVIYANQYGFQKKTFDSPRNPGCRCFCL